MTTQVPCSSFLSRNAVSKYRYDGDWWRNFGKSPECLSYASLYQSGGVYTLSGCAANVTSPTLISAGKSSLPSQIPNPSHFIYGEYQHNPYCCGDCDFDAVDVDVFFWPDDEAVEYCNRRNATLSRTPTYFNSSIHSHSIGISAGVVFVNESSARLTSTVINGNTLYEKAF